MGTGCRLSDHVKRRRAASARLESGGGQPLAAQGGRGDSETHLTPREVRHERLNLPVMSPLSRFTALGLFILALPAFTLAAIVASAGSREVVYDFATRASAGGTWWPDGNIGVILNANGRYTFNAANGSSELQTSGTLDQPAQSRTNVVYSSLKASYNYLSGGELYRDPASGRLLHFYHCEVYLDGNARTFRSSLGLAVSTDTSATRFQDLGVILSAPGTGPVEMCGAPYVVGRDGFIYVYFNAGGLAVARARLSEVLSNALAGRSTPFLKHYRGEFNEPGLGGNATVIQAGACQWMDVAYDSYLNRYVLIVVANNDLWVSWSDDGVTNWTPRQRLENEPGESFYPTIISAGPDPKVVDGSKFYIYYSYSIAGAADGFNRWSDAVLARRLITLDDTTANSVTVSGLPSAAELGSVVTFSATTASELPATYQWAKNGSNLAGATQSKLVLTDVKSSDAGTYTVSATTVRGVVISAPVSLQLAPTSRLANLSIRTSMANGQTLIFGAVVAGGAKSILLRAAGPALNSFGLTGMVDPRLDLFTGGAAPVATNDNWPATLGQTFAAVGAFGFTAGSRDAALSQSLAGAFTAHARGTGPGMLLVEAYDAGTGNAARLTNVSARNQVAIGDDVLIAGFAIAGSGFKEVLVRAVGPTLASFGVSGSLADPRLTVLDSSGRVLSTNDDWEPGLAATFAQVGAFPLLGGSKDAAVRLNLAAGAVYTVKVEGANNGTGEALIEVYEIP